MANQIKRVAHKIFHRPMNKIVIVSPKHKRIEHVGFACMDELFYDYAGGEYSIDKKTYVDHGKFKHYFYEMSKSEPQNIFLPMKDSINPQDLAMYIKRAQMYAMTKDRMSEAMNMIPILIVIGVFLYMIVSGGI